MVDEADDLGEKAGYIGLDIPLFLKQFFLVYGVGADNAVEEPLAVRLVEIVDGGAVEKRQGHGANDFGGAEVLQVAHSLDQGAARADHVVSHEDRLAVDIAEEAHLLDVGGRGVLADLGVVALLVQEGERALEGVGVELVAVHRARVRRQDDEVLGLQVDDAHELFDDLERGVEVLQAQLVEAVLDLARVDVQGDDPGHAQVFEDGADARGGEAFPALLLVLAGIGVHREHQVDLVGPRLGGRVDGHEEVEYVVVHRHDAVFSAVVERYGLVVLDVLEDEDVFAAHGLEDLGLHLAVGEESMPGVDLEARGAVLVRRPRHVEQARIRVVREIDLPDGQFLADMVPRCQGLGLPVESPLVNPGQLADDLVRESFGAGASENTQLRGIGITHGVAALGMEWLVPSYTEATLLSIRRAAR